MNLKFWCMNACTHEFPDFLMSLSINTCHHEEALVEILLEEDYVFPEKNRKIG